MTYKKFFEITFKYVFDWPGQKNAAVRSITHIRGSVREVSVGDWCTVRQGTIRHKCPDFIQTYH